MTALFRHPGAARATDPGRARPQPARAQDDPAALPRHDARALTGANQTAQIALDGMVYTLRITRAGKLILTK